MTSGTESTQPPPTKKKIVTVPVPFADTSGSLTDHSMLVVYIAVPIILAAVIISSIVIMYYKK